MKRNLDLIRQIMLRIEASDKDSFYADDFKDLTDNEKELRYNLHLMYEAGMIAASQIDVMGSMLPEYRIYWLTNNGCDFLGDIRDKSIWLKTKDTLTKIGTNAALDVVSTVAKAVIKSSLSSYLQLQ